MIPDHLAALPWYPGHLAWLRSWGRYAPGPDAVLRRADLTDANLSGADLTGSRAEREAQRADLDRLLAEVTLAAHGSP